MIYYQDDEVVIRSMDEADARVFTDEYTLQGWHPDFATYHMRLKDQAEGRCIALTAVYKDRPAGSVYVYRTPHDGPFKDRGWPEIHDFSVLEKYQRKGIGQKLMDAAEKIAAQYAWAFAPATAVHKGCMSNAVIFRTVPVCGIAANNVCSTKPYAPSTTTCCCLCIRN